MRHIILLSVALAFSACVNGGSVKYKDSVAVAPTSVLGTQTVGSFTITTPDGLTMTSTNITQDATAPVSAWKFAKGVGAITDIVGSGGEDILSSTADLIKGDE